MTEYDHIQTRISLLRQELLNHRLYRHLRTEQALRTFMEMHVFAVWDFMSLLKALQQNLTCVTLPWVPPRHPSAARLINEIVLAEESDCGLDGAPASHFEMYVSAMTECGADTSVVDSFLKSLTEHTPWQNALAATPVAAAIQEFVRTTLSIVDSEDLCAIAGAFTFGREQLLPDLFEQIVAEINAATGGRFAAFEYYLHRHIELDGDEHGAMAQELMESLCTDHESWKRAETAAVQSLQARQLMWDSIADVVERQTAETDVTDRRR